MALRVLLADNSETIKKVIQLTLQDYAVDLRIVSSGLDVLDVVSKFKPEIIFVDILLQKKSGYEVVREIKQHPTLGSTPVILMWSGFMEFDEEKAKNSLADARLEKPFDAKTLREMVQKFVAKTKSNPLSSFLELPDLPPAQEQAPKTVRKISDPLQDLEKIKQESLKFAPLSKEPTKTNIDITQPDITNELPTLDLDIDSPAEEFEMQTLSNPSQSGGLGGGFKLDLPDDISGDDFNVDTEAIEKVEDMSFLLNPSEAAKAPAARTAAPTPAAETKSHPILQAAAATQTAIPKPAPASSPTNSPANLSQNDIEKIVDAKVQEIIEKVVWQVVPEVASQIIRKEIERLLKDNDSSP